MITRMKNAFYGLIIRFINSPQPEKKISELENRSIASSQTDMEGEKTIFGEKN